MIDRTLVIVLDDVGPPLGISPIRTPMMWDIRRAGQVHSLWTTPSCSASRAALLCRAYPHRTGIGTIIRHDATVHLDPQLARLPRGGTTALFGKYHLSREDEAGQHAIDLGLEFWDGHAHNLGAGDSSGYFDWDRYRVRRPSTILKTRSQEYQPEVLQAQVADAIINYRADLLFCMCSLIHKPYHDPPNVVSDSQPAAMLAYLDEQVGWMVALANQAGYKVMIMTDNGAASDVGGGKGTLYQSGIASELITLGFGLRQEFKLDLPDVMTLIDGQSGPSSERIGTRDYHYTEKFNPNGVADINAIDPDRWSWAIERGGWKLIRNAPANHEVEFELYNLKEDPYEATSLAEDQRAKVRELRRLAAGVHDRGGLDDAI